jgi:hypothetical protein
MRGKGASRTDRKPARVNARTWLVMALAVEAYRDSLVFMVPSFLETPPA